MNDILRGGWLLGTVLGLSLAGCATPTQDTRALRQALDGSAVSLRESVQISESATDGGTALKATLLTRSSVFSVEALAGGALSEIRVDTASGDVVAQTALAGELPSCPGAVALSAAVVAAEDAVSGEAVTVAPDDDDACDREVKVLDGDDVLWEVKIAPDGTVKETEVADDADETEG